MSEGSERSTEPACPDSRHAIAERSHRVGYQQKISSGQNYSVAPRSSSSPGNSFTDGYFMISLREIFQAF